MLIPMPAERWEAVGSDWPVSVHMSVDVPVYMAIPRPIRTWL